MNYPHRGRRTVAAILVVLQFLTISSSWAFLVRPHQQHGRHSIFSSLWGTTSTTNSRLSPSLASSSASDQEAVVVKRLPDSAVELNIPVPGAATKAAYDKVCIELSKTIQIPGFRKGSRIPPPVLEQAMAAKGGRNALKVQAINELTAQLVESSLKEQALDPIGQAVLQTPAEELADSYKPGEPLILPVKCDVWPEIRWNEATTTDKPYTGLTGTYKRKPFDEEKMEKALTDLKERYATLELITDPSYKLQMGDACTVNMEGYMAAEDGVSKGDPLPDTASGDNVEVVLGPGRYMEGLVEGLVGASTGETRTVSVSFPENLRDKSLAGKRAIFDVNVLQASKRLVPEVTDDFANTVRAGMTAEGLLEELRKAVDEDDTKEFMPARNQAIMEALSETLEVDVPDTLVTNQAREKFAAMMAEMREGGTSDDLIKEQITPENFNKYKDIIKPQIVKDFKVSMATDEIARLEGITVPDFKVDEQMENIKKDVGEDEEFDENVIRSKVETTLVRNAVMDWLAEHSNLEAQYEDENEEFDDTLMEELANQSLEREAEQSGVDVPQVAMDAEIEIEAEVDAVTTEADVEATSIAEEETREEAKSSKDESARYGAMDLEDRAYNILLDLGMIGDSNSD